MPPIMPPTDIQRKNPVRNCAGGRRLASSPWQASAITKNAARLTAITRKMLSSASKIKVATSAATKKGCAASTIQCGMTGLGRKHDDEGHKIERERDHPEERRRGDVRSQMRGDRDQQGRRNGGEPDPDQRIQPGRRRRAAAVGLRRGLERAAGPPQQHPADRDQDDQQIEQNRPDAGLLAELAERLDHERIAQQRQEAADIARRVEEVRVLGRRMIGAREPGLQQRRVGREREERQPDRNREQPEQPERLALRRRLAPARGDRERQRRRSPPPSPRDA